MAAGLTKATCQMCKHPALAQMVRSPLGRVVTVIFCTTCDIGKPPK